LKIYLSKVWFSSCWQLMLLPAFWSEPKEAL